MSVSAKIKELRKSRGLSQQDFGDLIGLTRDQVAGIESKNTPIKLDLMQKITKAFNVSAQYLTDDLTECDCGNDTQKQDNHCSSCADKNKRIKALEKQNMDLTETVRLLTETISKLLNK